MSKKDYYILSILALVQFVNVMDLVIMMPLGPQLRKALDISPEQFSILVASYGISAGIVGFISAFYIDRWNRKLTLALAFACFTLCTLLCGFVNDYTSLLISRTLAGMFGGVLGTLVLIIVSETIPMSHRGTAMAIVMGSFSIAAVVGIPLGIYAASNGDWHTPFLAIAIAGLVTMPFLLLAIPNLRGVKSELPHWKPNFKALHSLLEDRNQLIALFFIAVVTFASMCMIPFVADSMSKNIGFNDRDLMWMYFFGGLSTMLTSPLFGRLCDKFGNPAIYVILTVIAIAPMLLITSLEKNAFWLIIVQTSCFFAFVSGRNIPAMTLVSGAVPAHKKGSFMSFNSSVRQISSALATAAGGQIVASGPNGELLNFAWVGIMGVAVSIISLIILPFIKIVDIKPVEKKIASKDA